MFQNILKKAVIKKNTLKLKSLLENTSYLQNVQKQYFFQLRKEVTQQEMSDAAKICDLVAKDQLAEIKNLVENNDVNVNSCDYDYRTALHIAASYGKKEIVDYLLAKGALNTVDRWGQYPIHDAIRHGHQHIIDVLDQYPTFVLSNDQVNKDNSNMQVVFQQVMNTHVFNYEVCAKEIEYFYNQLGMDDYYFKFFTPPQIAKHLNMIIAAKNMTNVKKNSEDIMISQIDSEQSYFIFSTQNKKQVQKQVYDYIQQIPIKKAVSVVYMKSQNPANRGGTDKLEMYVVNSTKFENPDLVKSDDIYSTSTSDFLVKKPSQAFKRYQKMIKQAFQNPAPVMETFVDEASNSMVFMYAVNQGRVLNDSNVCYQLYLFELEKIFQNLNIDVHKKYAETFSNGIIVYTLFTKQQVDPKIVQSVFNISNLLLTSAPTTLTQLYLDGKITGRMLLYFQSTTRFSYYFMREKHEEFEELYKYLKSDKKNLSRLVQYQQNNRTEVVNYEVMNELIANHADDLAHFYIDFSRRMTGDIQGHQYKDIDQIINKFSDPIHRAILKSFHLFNQSVVKTNFYKTTKAAVGYRLDPTIFLKDHKIPEIPFGIFMIAGRDFNGFHVRFRDISRGGVRLIKSHPDAYENNRLTQFQENYNLAYTQKMKNKDIPESGSKGTILMTPGKEHLSEFCFMQYVDALSDVMLVTDGVIDKYNKPEFIFLGPDENTADYMDQAALFMKKKGYQYWKSFTTGKSVHLGGIPHDVHGMTTRSVRAYVKGIQNKLGLKEEECTKFITGGPDGDLGSNEIHMGHEKIVGIVDGSGVLYDPLGIDKEELLKLVKQRSPIRNYKGKLSADGYLVRVTDNGIDLPDGTRVENGTDFRNNFHLQEFVKADFFVPCGGRPEAVNMMNVDKMFDKNGKPRFKYIVEGANLFISEDARAVLEDAGITLFKDASTNKGGVTSSSLEVLAGLAMDDIEFSQNMQVQQNGTVPDFYKTYVQQICQIVEEKANLEFEYLYAEIKRTGKHSHELTNELSESINNLKDVINQSKLFDNEKVKTNVFKKMVPQSLQDKVGLENIFKRVPLAYQQAMLSTYLASMFQYQNKGGNNVYNFYEFMKKFEQ